MRVWATRRLAGLQAWASRRNEQLRPQQVVLWMSILYGCYAGLNWIVDDRIHGSPLVDSLIPVAFIAFCLSLLLREPWRMRVAFLLSGLVLPALDAMFPELRSEGSGLMAMVAMLIVVFALAYSQRHALLILVFLCWLGWGAASEMRDPDGAGFTRDFVVPGTLLMATSGWAVGSVIRRRRAVEDELERLAERRRRERVVLARELHDSVARDLTIIAMQSAVLRTTDRVEEQQYARDAIEETARSGLDALKRLLVVLRADEAVDSPTFVRDLEAENLADAVAESARHLAMLGYQITTSTIPTDLPRAAEVTAVRVVREGTTNITKHAAAGVVCHIDTARRGDELIVRVDNRCGTDTTPRVPSTGLGIESLAERLRLLGGSLTSGGTDGHWVLEARIPLTAPLAGSVSG